MAGKFDRSAVALLLVQCHRRCCICKRWCGVKIETDHIEPEGGDSIDNAIPVCFECHAEIHGYNVNHPRGRKFTPDELRGHKSKWLDICKNRPEVFVEPSRDADVGPVQGMIDELDFNLVITRSSKPAAFRTQLFERAMKEGAVSTLVDELCQRIHTAYAAMDAANQALSHAAAQRSGTPSHGSAQSDANNQRRSAGAAVQDAHDALLKFLGHPA